MWRIIMNEARMTEVLLLSVYWSFLEKQHDGTRKVYSVSHVEHNSVWRETLPDMKLLFVCGYTWQNAWGFLGKYRISKPVHSVGWENFMAKLAKKIWIRPGCGTLNINTYVPVKHVGEFVTHTNAWRRVLGYTPWLYCLLLEPQRFFCQTHGRVLDRHWTSWTYDDSA